MNQTEFEELLNRHGADLAQWPEPVRTAARQTLAEQPAWHSLIQSMEALEHKLDGYLTASVDLADLEQNILKQTVRQDKAHQEKVPQQTLLDQFLSWLLPEQNLWRPALVACLPIMMGLSIGLNINIDSINIDDSFTLEEELSLTGLEYVAWEPEK